MEYPLINDFCNQVQIVGIDEAMKYMSTECCKMADNNEKFRFLANIIKNVVDKDFDSLTDTINTNLGGKDKVDELMKTATGDHDPSDVVNTMLIIIKL